MGSMKQEIASIANSKLRLAILDEDAVRRIHAASLDVIERVGVRFPSPKALDLLEAHGAQVDRESMVARIPGHIIEQYLAKAPPAYALAAADPALDLPLDGEHCYLGTDGCGVEVLDAFSGQRRPSTKQDVEDIARVADALPAIAFHWIPVSAQDAPPKSRGLHELQSVWGVSRKHVQTESIVDEAQVLAAIEMASILAGGEQELRQRPLLSIMQCTISPLSHDPGSLEAGLAAAGAGLPVGFMTMASCAFTGPATLAGTMVVGNAEVLSALALMQMAHPGCPVFYAAAQTAMDLRSGGYTGGGPEDYLFGAATNVLADFYGLPLSMGAFATGAKEPDWQAAVDNSFSSLMAVSTGSDMLLGAGLLHGSRIFSYEMLLLDTEIWSILRAMFKGIPVDDDALALDAIREIGPRGTFLTHPHTLQHLHDLWVPSLMDRRPYGEWEKKRDGARQWAGDKARGILRQEITPCLDPHMRKELQRVIATFERG
jgi:trimethylamine--corrinoid protein Co-methyltransferase